MNCEQLVTYLSDYIDKGLDEDLASEAREHLASCHQCQVVLNTTQKTILLYKNMELKAIPAERRSALFQHLQSALAQRGDCENKS